MRGHPLSAEHNKPIGVFDSGMGGLTVLAALRDALPDESFLYLGDTARLPYGTKSRATVERYALQATQQLVQRDIKALVVACNTASAMALPCLQQAFAGLPIFGVVEPGADAATRVADSSGILVLATESTIQGGAYQRALTSRAGHLPVFGRSCPLWVTLAEQGQQARQLTETVLLDSLRGFVCDGPSTILLGCTHFPVFQTALRALVASSVRLVDSAQTAAAVVSQALQQQGLLATEQRSEAVRYFATDGADRFKKVGSYFIGTAISHVELIDI